MSSKKNAPQKGRVLPTGSRTVQPIRLGVDREAVERYLRSRSIRDYTLFRVGVYTGRRIGDLLALRVGDVAAITDRGALRIRDRLVLRESKTSKEADITLHGKARSALSKYLKARVAGAPSKGALLLQPLFLSERRGKDGELRSITRQRAGQILRRAAKACGLDDRIGCHSMRKTFGYLLHGQGIPLTVIGSALNHSNPATTKRYIGLQRDDIDDAISALP